MARVGNPSHGNDAARTDDATHLDALIADASNSDGRTERDATGMTDNGGGTDARDGATMSEASVDGAIDTGPSDRSPGADMTVDTEDRVFNAISATSYLMVRNAGVENTRIEMVELFMKTTTGGAAGRFQMSREDAEALNNRTISQQEYFVRKVIY